jgi:peptide/nickel transport system substrate-binding protein
MNAIRRRRGVGRAQSVVAALTAVGLVALAACSSGRDTGSEEPQTTTIKNLVVDSPTEPDSLDPFYRNTAEAQRFYRLVYSSLLKWNEDGSLVPDLATDLPEVSEDGLTWTIKIRSGVTFHDGSPLTADDVVFTFEEAKDPENGAVWRSSLQYMESVEATDDTTVVLKLSEPYAYMASRLAMIPILSDETPYAVNDTYATSENGSGPYKLAELKRGDLIKLERFADYYGEQPPFETITLKVVPEDASRIARLLSGDTHIVPALPVDQVDLVNSRGANAKVVEKNVVRLFLYPSMLPSRPTSNTDFRLAIAWAADRQRIVDQVYGGAGRPNSTYLTYGTLYHDEDLGLTFGARPDVEKAKQHLAASGVNLDRKLNIIAVNKPTVVAAMTILQANLKEIGIEATVEAQEVAGFYSALVSGEYDLIAFDSPVSTSSGFAPDYVHGGLHSKSANNFAKFGDPEMDRLLEAALTARTEAEQAAAWKAVQERDVETQGNIQIVVAQTAEAWSKQLVGYEPSALLWLNTILDVK